ncbi:ABC transporter ATP-binding protein [Nocardia sp. NPDC004168]|uniref:ABC transporter ATP-binding protein n=1 Tax=Nocardia sp. NPDC004168 TaxID=3154452 RepID=UPI0033B638AA
MKTCSPRLECRRLVCGHGTVPCLRPVELSVSPGTVIAVLGPNGAGKSTLLNTLAGMLPPLGGDIVLDGVRLRGGRPRQANKAGIVLVPDDRALFTSLTVRETLILAKGFDGAADHVLDLFPVLKSRLSVSAGALSGGEQQMLAIARALIQRPKVLLIDELSMGLAPVIVEKLLPVVRHIAEGIGAVVVIVEQHVRLALEVADEAVVLVHGDVVLRGAATELAADRQRLEAAYLGGHIDGLPKP